MFSVESWSPCCSVLEQSAQPAPNWLLENFRCNTVKLVKKIFRFQKYFSRCQLIVTKKAFMSFICVEQAVSNLCAIWCEKIAQNDEICHEWQKLILSKQSIIPKKFKIISFKLKKLKLYIGYLYFVLAWSSFISTHWIYKSSNIVIAGPASSDWF